MTDQAPSKANLFLSYGLVFLGTFLVLQFLQGPQENSNPVLDSGDVGVEMAKDSYAIGKDIQLTVKNNTQESLTFAWTSESTLLAHVYRYEKDGFEAVNTISTELKPCTEDSCKLVTLVPGKKTQLSLGNYAYTYFGEIGRYKVGLEVEGKEYQSPEFEIHKPSLLTRAWRFLVYTPILNGLVGIITLLPGHYLGWAILILTFLIRTILLVPSARAMQAQKRMQEMQPKIDALKEKYGDDQARLAQETMLLWKQHNVSPFSSCLPLLIQFPILIALFYVIRGGLSPDQAGLLYPVFKDFSLTEINPHFAGLNLLERNILVLPLIVGVLQFIQMQLIGVKSKKDPKKPANEMESANQMMKYIMPVMIAFFTSQTPAAVGLYWGASTFYGVVQQLVINRKPSDSVVVKSEDDVQIRVINKNSHGKRH